MKQNVQIFAGAKPHADRMARRKALQLILGGGAAGAMIPGVAAAHPVREHIAHRAASGAAPAAESDASWKPSFLDEHQNETLIVLAERIVPGSSKAQVSRFIDLAMTVESAITRGQFLRALAAFEGEALQRHRAPFKQLSESEQVEILTAAAASPLTEVAKVRSGDWVSSVARGFVPPPLATLGDCFEYLKGWISGAYYTTEIGMKELGWTGNSAYEDFPGCPHPEGHH
jgi:hypothetical protein